MDELSARAAVCGDGSLGNQVTRPPTKLYRNKRESLGTSIPAASKQKNRACERDRDKERYDKDCEFRFVVSPLDSEESRLELKTADWGFEKITLFN